MSVGLERLIADGVLGPMHVALAQALGRLDPQGKPTVPLAAAMVSEQLSRGHVCLDLNQVSEIAFTPEGQSERHVRYRDWPNPKAWMEDLMRSGGVTCREVTDRAEDLRQPLVLDASHTRLYLARYWFYQQKMAADLAERLALDTLPMDERQLRVDIERLFPGREQTAGFDQCVAAANSVDQRFSVITGGPGTGKTTTVARLIALRMLQHEFAASDSPPLRVLLMAPTGKAAQRLNESLGRATRDLPVPDRLRTQLNAIRAGTIHRLLRWTPLPPERGGPFLHSSAFPLEADLVLVDESSMVDIGLMWHLLSAVPRDAQLILIGDRDQLASVEAGGVLGDLCGDGASGRYDLLPPERRQQIEQRTGLELSADAAKSKPTAGSTSGKTAGGGQPPAPSEAPSRPSQGAVRLAQAVSQLRYSHRFDSTSELGRLAETIRAGDARTAIAQLRSASTDQIQWLDSPNPATQLQEVLQRALEYYAPYLDRLKNSPDGSADVLKSLNAFRILTAHREGRWGEEQLNLNVAQALEQAGLIERRPGYYLGESVLVTQNNYGQQLFNGDVGVVVRNQNGEGLAVLFEDATAEDGCRRVPASLVGNTKACYAMTIHKSQGSEFHRVMVVLPPYPSPILTRELLYTAITRVCDATDPQTGQRRKGQLFLVATEEVLEQAIVRRIRRTSGLRDALYAMSPA